ncbi:MAG: pilus assembly protein PilM [bacterium]|nr:pilus assembly protein PilM [bacterium]
MFLPPPYAIDIGDRTMKIAQLAPLRWWHRATPTPRFRTLVSVDLDAGWVVDGTLRDPAPLAALLRKTIAATPRFHRSSFAVTTLPENRTFLTTVVIAPEGNETREAALRRVVRAAVPIDAARAVITSTPIPGDTNRVAIAAVPTDVVESYASLFESVGLTPIACVSEAEALAGAIAFLPAPEGTGATLILDLGATRTGAVMTTASVVIASITIPLSGEQLTAALAAKLKIDPTAAERAKRDVDCTRAGHDDPAATAIAHALTPLIDGIARLREFVTSRFAAPLQPTRIVLTGGGAALTGLDEFLREKTKLPVTRFAISSGQSEADQHLTSTFATAFGLSRIALDPAAALATSPL